MPKPSDAYIFKSTKQWFSDASMKNFCCVLLILAIPITIYLVTLFSIFFFNSDEWNDNFLEVMSLTRSILDRTNFAIRDVHSVTDRMNVFMDDHPDFLDALREGFTTISGLLQTETKEKITHVLDWTVQFLDNNTFYADNIIQETYNITHFILEIKQKLEGDRKFEISF